MGTNANNTAGTSATTPTRGQPQNPEVGTGNGATPTPIVGGPPVHGAPNVPAGFVAPVKAKVAALLHPLPSQESHVDGVVTELVRLATQPFWQGVQENGMPSPAQFASRLTVASAWSSESKKAKAWAAYAASERGTDWNTALVVMNQFAPMLHAYVSAHPEMADEVTATLAFIEARAVAAQRGVSTRTAPKVTRTRATKLSQQAAAANTEATAEEAAAALRHGTGGATVVQPAPTAPTGPAKGGAGTP